MSVEVVTPADPGHPRLPMPSRRSAEETGQIPLPMPPVRRTSAVERGRVEPPMPARRPVVDHYQPQLPMSLRSSAGEAEVSRPSVDRSQARPAAGAPAPQPAVEPERPEPSADRLQPELPLRAAAVEPTPRPAVDHPRPMPPRSSAAKLEPQPAEREAVDHPQPIPPRRPVVDHGQSQLPMPLRSSVAGAGNLDAPRPPAPPRRPVVDHGQSQLPMSMRPPAPPAAAGLLAQARRGLADAERETDPAERFIAAYLAALRGAAAVLAARGRPHRGRARPASTWVLLDSVAPELREWSAFFASNSAARAAAQAGITGKVTAESADGLVRAATPFLELVRRLVHGLPITGEAHVA
ncbi:SAV_6107 family HEPN domain-containing protein [Amycolatopsis nalaikhensis]|uniref:SAV_6107 family HEPN domain-containing protein n=2 Tax=Pseudonocardiaceae TaxID=2070 RepID=A0ABY8XN00_9PSEU|nr:SAV_6107 family HEPN domain-containing protein [Amycolatopsis sp. 2-2]WIV56963.1 SAV_6107 family HEPN domain-containing protein [Amycolatopsis sp. 2-2]